MAEVASLVIEVGSGSIDKAVSGLSRLSVASREAETATDALSGAFSRLGAIMASLELYEAAKNTIMLAARYETLGATLGVMGNNAGRTKDEMLDFQQKLEETGISAIKARGALQIMAAAQLNLAESANLGRVAQDAATLAGINSSDAFNNLVRGITTGEVRIIRHMGIMANFTTALKTYADAHGKTVPQLNAHERAEARLQNVLLEGEKRNGVYLEAMTTAGKQMLSMQRYTENLQVKLGELFNPSTNAVVFELVESFRQVNEQLDKWEASGEKAVFISTLRHNVMGLVEFLKSSVVFIWDHANAIKIMGEAYLAIKLGQTISGWISAGVRWYASINQGAAIRQNELRDVLATTYAKNAEAAKAVLAAEMKIAAAKGEQGNLIVSTVLTNKLEAAQRSQMAAAIQVATVQKALAAEIAAANTATSIGSTLMSALGGPVGIAIAAIGLLVIAWQSLKDNTDDASKSLETAAHDRLKVLSEDIARASRVMELIKNGKTQEEANKIARVEQDIARDTVLLKEQQRAVSEKLVKAEQDLAVQRATNERGANNKGLVTAAQQRVDLLNKELQKWKDIEETTVRRNRQAFDANKALEALRKKSPGSDDENTEEKTAKVAAIESKIADLVRQTNVERMKGRGWSDEYLRKKEEEEKLTADILSINAKIHDLQKLDKPENAAQITLLRQEITARKELSAAKLGSDGVAGSIERLQNEKDWNNALDDQVKTYEDLEAVTAKLARENAHMNKTEEELHIAKLRATSDNVTDAATREKNVELYKAEVALNKQLRAEKEEQHRLDQMATSLNKRHTEDKDRLADLNKLKAQGKLIEGVYEKAWFEVMMKGDSAMAYIVQSTSKLFESLGGYLGNLFLNTGDSFRKMMANMTADLTRFFANEAMKKLMMMVFGSFLGSSPAGGGGGGTGSTGGLGPNGIYTGPMASGGPVVGNAAYLVGEHGPEMFIPGGNGNIVPNNQLGGGNVTVMVNVDANGVQTKQSGSHKENMSQLGNLIGDSVRRILADERRPGGILYGH